MCKSQPDRDRGSGSRRGGGRSSASKWSKAPQGGTHARACQRSLLLGSSPRPYARLCFPHVCSAPSTTSLSQSVSLRLHPPSLCVCVCTPSPAQVRKQKHYGKKLYLYVCATFWSFVPVCTSCMSVCAVSLWLCVCKRRRELRGLRGFSLFTHFWSLTFELLSPAVSQLGT